MRLAREMGSGRGVDLFVLYSLGVGEVTVEAKSQRGIKKQNNEMLDNFRK